MPQQPPDQSTPDTRDHPADGAWISDLPDLGHLTLADVTTPAGHAARPSLPGLPSRLTAEIHRPRGNATGGSNPGRAE